MDKSRIKILVVDDERDITYYTAKMLRYDGFTVFEALDGATALEIFHKEHPHICVIEPRFMAVKFTEIKSGAYLWIDGMDVLREIKNANSNVKCIAITRMKNSETEIQARELGANHYLLKPTMIWRDKVQAVAETI